MKFYIIQSEERDIDYDLLERLAEILSGETGIPKIDAKPQMKHSYGIFEISEEQQAKKVSEQFGKLGLDNFILREDELVTFPKIETVYNLSQVDIKDVRLVAAGLVLKKIEKTKTRYNILGAKLYWLRFSMGEFMRDNIDSMYRRVVKREIQRSTYIDIFTRHRHFRMQDKNIRRVVDELISEIDIKSIYLNECIKGILEGRRGIIRFSEVRHYDRYLSWLVQLRYAKPERQK
jgi:hypothetical protein